MFFSNFIFRKKIKKSIISSAVLFLGISAGNPAFSQDVFIDDTLAFVKKIIDDESITTSSSMASYKNSCEEDPRVITGLVSLNICVGARLFFDETFDGNGRTCGSCHAVTNNYTIDPLFISQLPENDPLFIAEHVEHLKDLEIPLAMRVLGNIKANADGFDNLDGKFVSRSVPHIYSMAASISRDPADGTDSTVVERTGWAGDGAPGDGSLRQFVNGAITQHFPKDLGRTVGTSFRLATEEEMDMMLAFQLSLGRINELNLNNVRLTDEHAEAGRKAYLDPMIGRCQDCHANGGANSLATGKNTNFDTGTELISPAPLPRPIDRGIEIFDGGFGGQNLDSPNFAVHNPDQPNAYGDGTFNTPSVIEAADTGPYFHHHSTAGEIPTEGIIDAVMGYPTPEFNGSPAGQDLIRQYGTPVTFDLNTGTQIAQFLKVLNVAFNLDMAHQRMTAAITLIGTTWTYRQDVQNDLMNLANEEIEDALNVMQGSDGPVLHAETHRKLKKAQQFLQEAQSTSSVISRLELIEKAITRVENSRSVLGTNINFTLAEGNLMN